MEDLIRRLIDARLVHNQAASPRSAHDHDAAVNQRLRGRIPSPALQPRTLLAPILSAFPLARPRRIRPEFVKALLHARRLLRLRTSEIDERAILVERPRRAKGIAQRPQGSQGLRLQIEFRAEDGLRAAGVEVGCGRVSARFEIHAGPAEVGVVVVEEDGGRGVGRDEDHLHGAAARCYGSEAYGQRAGERKAGY